jgi:hypothetical protein
MGYIVIKPFVFLNHFQQLLIGTLNGAIVGQCGGPDIQFQADANPSLIGVISESLPP